jgi:hypothetical protein
MVLDTKGEMQGWNAGYTAEEEVGMSMSKEECAVRLIPPSLVGRNGANGIQGSTTPTSCLVFYTTTIGRLPNIYSAMLQKRVHDVLRDAETSLRFLASVRGRKCCKYRMKQ